MQIKLLFTFCLCLMLPFVAKAESWLYWCVEESACYQEVEFEYLKIGVAHSSSGDAVTDGNGDCVYLEQGDVAGDQPYHTGRDYYEFEDTAKSTVPLWSILGDYANSEYSYYVEMYAWDAQEEGYVFLGKTPAVSYATMQKGGHSYDSTDITTGGIDKTPYAYANIPEPSSAILLLTGVAALVLKRRKA